MGAAAPLAAASSIASLGLGAASAIQKGAGEEAAYDYRAAQAEEAARFGKQQAELTDLTMRERLNTTLANIDAVRAAANIDPTSPTTAAIADWNRMLSDRQRTAAKVTAKAQAASDEASAKYFREAGDYAVTQSYLKAGADVAGGLGKGFMPGGSFSLTG